jgi:hypothetical protein
MSPNAENAQTNTNPPRVIFESLPFATLLDMHHPIKRERSHARSAITLPSGYK